MKPNKLTRQDAFNIVWRHYIVEGEPYAVQWSLESDNIPMPVKQTPLGEKSPTALLANKPKNPHVDVAFISGLESCHVKASYFVFDNINLAKVVSLYSRAQRRLFRRTMKYFLIAFAMNYDLTIPSETATNAFDIRLAAKNKR